MPVKSDDTLWLSEPRFFDEFDHINTDELLLSTSPLLSDDIWNKFEFGNLPLAEFTQSSNVITFDDEDLELDAVLEWSLDAITGNIVRDINSEIRNHDCMWAGHCGSKEHKPEGPLKAPRPPMGPPIALPKRLSPNPNTNPNSNINPSTNLNSSNQGRSLLINSRAPRGAATMVSPAALSNVNISVNVNVRPESPPSSDDDDHPRFKHETSLFDPTNETKTLQLLNDAISECDFDEDSDLCDYFEDSDVFAAGETRDAAPYSSPVESDHSYHKGKGPQLRTDHLGVQTPSDTEEEIDVVSVCEKQITTNRNCTTVLPTNPSIRDRQKLQRTVASAISNKREYAQPTRGIKTRLPLRISPETSSSSSSSSSGSSSSTKKHQQQNGGEGRRGVRRSRHHRHQKTGGGPKKRGYGNSSDSDTECSEKRSLHNNMERQRRVDLRNAFEDLRVLVPSVCCKERAAKVVILREAASYCRQLTKDSPTLFKEYTEQNKLQMRLRARLSHLRRSLAAKR